MKTPPVLSAALLGYALAANSHAQTTPSKEFLPSLPAGQQWKMIWHDEFDGTKLDETKWTRLIEGFHDYALLWTPQEYVFYVDGKEHWRTSAGGVSQVPEHIKLSEEIGKWGGDSTKATLPDYFEVDYVRVYEVSP